MRPIKYRAWDRNHNKMVYVGDEPKWATDKEVSCGDLLNWFEDKDLMQFTGLKDKNGKEIYHFDWLENDGRIFEVRWNEEHGFWFSELIKGEWSPKMSCPFDGAKIVGNKYEG